MRDVSSPYEIADFLSDEIGGVRESVTEMVAATGSPFETAVNGKDAFAFDLTLHDAADEPQAAFVVYVVRKGN